jgi:hypothetical protein
MSGTVSLTWFADRGFELDLTADLEDIQLRFAALPVPADGTVELAEGVELNKLDILFKCQAAIDGAPAQLQEARVAVRDGKLVLDAKLEDVENGLLYPLETEIPVDLPPGLPESGGPRNESPDEDDLDWGDETTFEAIAGDVPDAALLTEERDKPEVEEPEEEVPPKGLAALLQALKNLDDDNAEPVAPMTDEVPHPQGPATPNSPAADAQTLADGSKLTDQKMGPVGEAISLIELLIEREDLELEEDHEPAELGEGTAAILATPTSYESKAATLSEWLLDQPAVADLFLDDETLAQILSQW